MKESKLDKKSSTKTLLAAAMIIATVTMSFQGLTQIVAAGELNKTDTVLTSYMNYEDKLAQNKNDNLLKEYKKANYNIKTSDLEEERKQKPTSNDISMEKAAEIGAQAIWSYYKASLEGKTIVMIYNKPYDSCPRTTWQSSIDINDKLSYWVKIDSVTGEVYYVGCDRRLDDDINIGCDWQIEKNPELYDTKPIKELAKKINIVNGAVRSVKYLGQGRTNNDPQIFFEVTGENEERARIEVSRYDNALVGVESVQSYKYSLEYQKRQEEKEKKEMEAWIKKQQEENEASDTDEPSIIKIIEVK